MFELFHSGTHCGPFPDVDSAIAYSRRLLVSTVSLRRVDIRAYDASGLAGFGPVVAIVRVRGIDERDPDSIAVDRLA